MMMVDPRTLLADYVENSSESAFRELVTRYLDLVYSAAVRLVNGDRHLAEDIAQTVFADLARLAKTFSRDVMLGGWLHRHTCFVAATVMRAERRRQSRERQAVEMSTLQSDSNLAEIAPILDEAINQLGAQDRTAILLRFFEQRDFCSVGAALGSNEDAARMRVNRALEKLHLLLQRRGIALSTAVLGTVLAGEAVAAAPVGLAASISSAALTGAVTGGGAALTLVKIMAMSKLKLGILSVLAAAGVATPLMLQHQAQVRLRSENDFLRQQVEQQASFAAENERLAKMMDQNGRTNSSSLATDQLRELLRLRGEVTRLRAEARELARTKAPEANGPVDKLRQRLQQMPEKNIPELQILDEDKWAEDAGRGKLDNEDDVRQTLAKLRRAAKIRFVYSLGRSLNDYVKANNGQLPANLLELKPYIKPPVDDATFQRYELLHSGKLSDVPSGEPLVSEKAPVDEQYDTLFKIGLNGYVMQGIGKWSDGGTTNTWNFTAR